MDNDFPQFTEITVRIPEDLAQRLGTGGEIERRVLEAIALDEFKRGHLSRVELRPAARLRDARETSTNS
jgi:hypothetical protein